MEFNEALEILNLFTTVDKLLVIVQERGKTIEALRLEVMQTVLIKYKADALVKPETKKENSDD